MAKEKKIKPTFVSPYREVKVEMKDEDKTFCYNVEISSEEEIEKQKIIRFPCIKQTFGTYNNERTIKSHLNRHEKLFESNTREEVIKRIITDTSITMSEYFKYRTYARILETKLPLFEIEDEIKLVKFAIKSLDEYGCIHPQIKEILKRIAVIDTED
jgi:uncharacterized protein YjcR